MIDFLLCLVIVSLGIWGIHILFQEDHLLENVGDWLDENLPIYVNKPLWACPICMSSFWGTIGFVVVQFLFKVELSLWFYGPFIFCLCGFNTLLVNLTSKKRIIQELETDAFRQLFDIIVMRKNDMRKNEKKKNS